MNRRSFLTRLAKAVAVTVAAPTILPAATTYARQWRKQGALIVPFWIQEKRTAFCFDDEYRCVMEQLMATTTLRSFTWELPRAETEALLRRYPPPRRARPVPETAAATESPVRSPASPKSPSP